MKKSIFCCLLICSAAVAEEANDTDSYHANRAWSKQENELQQPQSSQSRKENSEMPCVRKGKNSLFKIGASYNYLWLTPNGSSTFGGSLGGLQASYEYIKGNTFYGGGLFWYRQGSTKHGSAKRDVLNFNLMERLGYTYSACDWACSLFSGFGFRYLQQELKQSSLQTLKFQYKQFYIPVGFFIGKPVWKDWVYLGLDFTWMPQVFPSVQINPIGGANWITQCRVDNFLIRLPIAFDIPNHPNYFIELTPSFEYWNDGKTTASISGGSSLGLPANRYIYLGAELNCGILF